MTESFTRDPLTGVFTRTVFEEIVKVEIEKFKRYGVKFSLLLLDLDHFKEVNDTLGHKAGDMVLVRVVEKLKGLLRESDVIGRWGGDEFIVLLPYTDEKSAMRVAKRIAEKLKVNVHGLIVGASCAFVTPKYGEEVSYKRMFATLDELLYRAKRYGRGHVGNMLLIKDRIVIPSFKFVSREKEYSLLKKYVLKDRTPFVIVSGETGIGKSRLVEEFLKRERLQFAGAKSFGPVRGIPLFSIKNLMVSLYRENREQFGEIVDKLDDEDRNIIGIFIPSLYKKPVEEGGYRSFFIIKLAEVLTTVLKGFNIGVLWIDDLQWVSYESLEVLKNLIVRGGVQIIANLRKEERNRIDEYFKNNRITYKEVSLTGLNRESTQDLLLSIFGEEVDDSLTEYVFRYSGGIPFYIEEIVSFLAQKGFLREQDGKILLNRVPDSVPSSLGDIISYKLRGFKDNELAIVRFVAVYHNPIDARTISEILHKDNSEVDRAIKKALQTGILGVSDGKVYFPSEGVRRLIVKEIPRGTYKMYHKLAGEFKERVFKERGIEPFELYDHFKKAGEKEKMSLWALRSGREARNRFASEQAFYYFREAFFNMDSPALKKEALLGMIRSGRIAGKVKDTTEIIEKYGKTILEDYLYEFYLGSIYILGGRVDDALSLLENALKKAPDTEFKAECMFEIAWVYRKQGRLNDCIKKLEEILKMKVSSRMHTMVLALYGGVLLEHGNIKKAEEILKKVIEEGEKTHTEYRLASAYINYALLKATMMKYKEAEKFYKKAIKTAEISGERGKLLIALNNLGTLYLSLGKLQEAEKYYMRGLDLAKETGNHSLEVIILNNLGSSVRERGLYKEAYEFYMKTLAKAREYEYPDWISHSISNILMTYANYENNLRIDKSLLEELENTIKKLDVPNEKAYAFLALADYYRKEGNFEKVREYMEKYKKLPRFIKDQYILNFYISMARFYDAQGNVRMSDYYIKKIEDLADSIEDMTTKAELYRNIADWYYEHKRFKKARVIYRKARKFARWLSEDSYLSMQKRMEEINEDSRRNA